MPSSALPPNPDPVLNVTITADLVSAHGLLPEEYDKIRSILGREPTLTELGIFGVMWSEHCSYKNSRKLLRGFPVQRQATPDGYGSILVKAGEENAGVVDIGDGWALCFKIESHNHPSAVEPFEGAATGVGGIIRDIFTMGARPVLLTNSLRFGELESPAVRRLFRGVVAGIAHYGNCIGIPTVGGDVYFDESYEGNPLVNALCLGVLRHDQIKRGAATGVGNPVYYVGAPTGRDGLGGASFASRELTEESQADRPAVQKGDPFMEKLLLEACLEMMAVPGLVVGIQDMGAAGLTCSTCETAGRGNSGIEIELDRVPQRETEMNSYEIMLSESQERMLVIVQKGREHELEAIFEKWDLPAVCIGEVKEGNRMVVKQHGVTVADIPALALTEEGPLYDRKQTEPRYFEKTRSWTPDNLPECSAGDLEEALRRLLSTPTIASKRWVYRQYDHMVMAGTVVEPGSDSAVVRLRLGEDEKYIAISNDGNGRYCYLNPYRGAVIAVIEALRNLCCSGAVPLAMTDNLNYGNPYKPDVYHTFAEGIRGLADACRFFDLPVLGGNVSLYNEHQKGAIDPTPVVGVAGLIARKEHITRQYCRQTGLDLILLGGLPDELGGSQYLKQVFELKTGDAPRVDLEAEKALHDFVRAQIRAGRVKAAHDLSEGGLLVAVAEMLFGDGPPDLGADLDLPAFPPGARPDTVLYGESQGRIVLAADPATTSEIIAEAKPSNVPAAVIGKTTKSGELRCRLPVEGLSLTWDIMALRETWETPIEQAMAMTAVQT